MFAARRTADTVRGVRNGDVAGILGSDDGGRLSVVTRSGESDAESDGDDGDEKE